MSDEEESAYDNTHRAFLQAFLSRSTFTFKDAKPILAAILTTSQPDNRPVLSNDITESDFLSYVSSINAAISPFDMEIRNAYTQSSNPSNSARGEVTRERVWALVNTTSDAITQIATTHSPDEIAFLKRVLDDMFEKYNTEQREVMAINNMQAVRLHKATAGGSDRTSGGAGLVEGNGVNGTQGAAAAAGRPAGQSQSITIMQADKMLKSMVDEGWFEIHRGDYYTLSPRALMELRGWLMETYNEPPDEDGEGGVERIKLCHACRDIVTDGQRCAIRSCKARLHDHCAQGVWRVQRSQMCPVCREEWSGREFVGMRAVVGHGGGNERRRTSTGGGGGGSGRRVSTAVVDGEASSEDEEA